MRITALVLTLAVAASALAAEPTGATSTAANTVTANKPEVEKPLLHEHPTLVQMLQRNNALRRAVGLSPHRISPALTKAAQNHAWYMAHSGAFSHESNGGPMYRAQRYGYRNLVRENIAMGQSNVSHVFSSWQSSGGHWANIASGTRDAGFGYAIGPDGSTYWVAVYGDGDSR
jgi:uncharacterized protein YkwD